MCSRFGLTHKHAEIESHFKITIAPPYPVAQSAKGALIRPTDKTLVIGGEGQIAWMGFGLKVQWDKRPLINARAETLTQKPTFRRLLGNRVVVPASYWNEWQKTPDGKPGPMLEIRPGFGAMNGLSNSMIGFAALTDGIDFLLVTTGPAPSLAHIHDRMPVILDPRMQAAWVSPHIPFVQMAPYLRPHLGPWVISGLPDKRAANPQLNLF